MAKTPDRGERRHILETTEHASRIKDRDQFERDSPFLQLIARNEDTYSRDGDFVNDAAMCRSIEGEVKARSWPMRNNEAIRFWVSIQR